jgi:hypothetical protein
MSKFGELFFENCLIGAIFLQKSFEKKIFYFIFVRNHFFSGKKRGKKSPPKKKHSSRLQ